MKSVKTKYGLLFDPQKLKFKFTLLDACDMFSTSLNEIKVETIKNCFTKSGFKLESQTNSLIEKENQDFFW